MEEIRPDKRARHTTTGMTFAIKIEHQRQFDTWLCSVTITQILQMEFNKKKIQRVHRSFHREKAVL